MEPTSVNLNYFKVFMAVFETRSMTGAAEKLHLTQSGVSQHIKSLEKELKAPLFLRTGKRIIPTPLALEIYPDLEAAFTKVQNRIATATGASLDPKGEVRIGMPPEFGVNIVVPKLAEIGQRYKKLNFEIQFNDTSALTNQLGSGELDFAFVDQARMDRRFEYETVGTETLQLCANREYMATKPRVTYSQNYFEALDYVEYKGAEPILRRWMLHHLKRQNLNLRVRAHIFSVQGVAKFITSGLGAGVLPDHEVDRLKKQSVDLYVFEGKSKPLRNEIRLIRLKEYPLNPASEITLKELRSSFFGR
jgi:DNA-binding transcriptional LysR family regulator